MNSNFSHLMCAVRIIYYWHLLFASSCLHVCFPWPVPHALCMIRVVLCQRIQKIFRSFTALILCISYMLRFMPTISINFQIFNSNFCLLSSETNIVYLNISFWTLDRDIYLQVKSWGDIDIRLIYSPCFRNCSCVLPVVQ